MNGALKIRYIIVNIFQNRQKSKSSGMRNLRIGKFVTVRKLRNAKMKYQSGICLIANQEYFTSLTDIPWLLRLFFFPFCINININSERDILCRIKLLHLIKIFGCRQLSIYLKELIFTQFQCFVPWEHSYSTFNLKTRVSASLILH